MFLAADLVPLFRKELELCKLRPDESVAIYSEAGARQEYTSAFAVAAGELGVAVVHVDLPLQTGRSRDEIGGRSAGMGLASSPAAVQMFKEIDLLIDLAMILWTPEQREVMNAGTRILSCVDPPEALARMFPTEDQRRLALEEVALLEGARVLRFTNDAGTDLTYELGQYPPHSQYGVADEPGRWDHFASTLAVTVANDNAVNGVVVLQPGDIIFPFSRFIGEPVRLTVKGGRIVDVDGEGFDAWQIRSHIEKFNDDRAYAISHVGWGLNEHARWDLSSTMDSRSFCGSVMFSIGPNTDFGGDNDTLCHVDIPMRDCSLYLDDELIIESGQIVKDSLRPGAVIIA
jgi:2,5-dihydroxypyridine 5,6-dioxygenase